MKSQIFIRGGPIFQKVKKVAKPSFTHSSGASTTPQRRRLDTYGYFKPVGISEVLGELELRTNQVDTTPVEIEELQDDKFVRNFNSPLTNLNDPLIIQVRPFNSPVIGVPMGRLMSSVGESSSTSTSAAPAEGVPPPR